MILQALRKLAENEKLIADPDFEFKPVAWIVRLRDDGTFITIESRRDNLNEGKTDKKGKPVKPKWVGRKALVPMQGVRTSGDAAAFAVDKAEYVLGVDPAGVRPEEKLLNRLGLFYDGILRCAEVTGDAQAAAVAAFGRSLQRQSSTARAELLPKDFQPGDLLMFAAGADPQPLHDRSSIRTYWKAIRNAVPPPNATAPPGRRCLITLKPVAEVPLFRKVKNVPGDASGGLSLVSFNSQAWESYGWEGEDNAPVSREAAEAAITALSRLLDPRPVNGEGESLPVRRIRLAEDTAIVFWSPKPAREVQDVLDAIPDIFDAPDEVCDVGNLLSSARTGVLKPLKEPAAFYAMTLTSVTGRVVMRDWLETTVADVQANLQAHFLALSCVRNTPPVKGRPPRGVMHLDELLDALAAPGRERKIPTALAADFLDAAFRGKPYPLGILQRALLRERAEVASNDWANFIRRDARAALIKAVMMRNPTFQIQLEASMDENRHDPGYLLGRLMAVLEDTQRLASGGVNASVKDKFYGAASATPAAVFPTMMDLFHKHARKARDERAGAITIREKLVDAILANLHAVPVHLDMNGQGLFVLGYHHQRYALYKKPGGTNTAASEADASEGTQA